MLAFLAKIVVNCHEEVYRIKSWSLSYTLFKAILPHSSQLEWVNLLGNFFSPPTPCKIVLDLNRSMVRGFKIFRTWTGGNDPTSCHRTPRSSPCWASSAAALVSDPGRGCSRNRCGTICQTWKAIERSNKMFLKPARLKDSTFCQKSVGQNEQVIKVEGYTVHR
jgi:hypothetical protein